MFDEYIYYHRGASTASHKNKSCMEWIKSKLEPERIRNFRVFVRVGTHGSDWHACKWRPWSWFHWQFDLRRCSLYLNSKSKIVKTSQSKMQTTRLENICFDFQHIRTKNPNGHILTIDEKTTDSTLEYLLWLPTYSIQQSRIVNSSHSMKIQPICLKTICVDPNIFEL